MKSLLELLATAISDPGAYTPRGNDYQEPIAEWGARAVAAMLVKEMLPTAPLLLTQDNQCTAEPMFCVMEEVTVYGMDPQWSDEELWIDTSDGAHEVPAPSDGEETETIIKTGKHVYKKVVMVAFTEEGAKEYLRQNGHNHRGKTSLYVESFNRCPEMIAIRALLMGLSKIAQP